jgi:hypothetical protein
MILIYDFFGRFIQLIFYKKKLKRNFRNRALCLPLLKYNIDIRYWIPKIMCGGIEKYTHKNEGIDLWLISR